MSTVWKRPTLSVTKPNRNFGGIYRSAEGENAGKTIGGVPLQTASDAVVAAVELGYKVADAQLGRGRRLAKQLGGAAQRAGVHSAAQPIDATERLLSRAMLLMLEWFEGAASDPQGPLRRLARAELDAVVSAFGLAKGGGGREAKTAHTHAPSPAPASAAPTRPSAPRNSPSLGVRHAPGTATRLVRVTETEWSGPSAEARTRLTFHHATTPTAPVLGAWLVRRAGAAELVVETEASHPPGVWRAAVCDAEGMQIGHVEIGL
ncbi:hypothetical protein QTH97_08830 [Variovorax sp. J22R24]|uniref:hypothetical protein n=1 Tax=Variovorax gracilis TaxID=3053502 RepID=UPI00257775B5|nr:hypothetical protein [Variovorax sp. J22R24]MDM0105034.1 hypothetical protein [Variovorax sp. J22R24]